MRQTTFLAALVLGAAVGLAGCGGGEHVPDSGNAEGFWTTSGSNPATQMVILSDRSLWGIYGANPTLAGIQGMMRGSADNYKGECLSWSSYYDSYNDTWDDECDDWIQYPSASGSFNQFDMTGNALPMVSWNFSGSATEAQALSFSLTDPKTKADSGTALSMLYDHRYDAAATVATVAGTYAGWTAFSGQARHNLAGINIFGSTLTLPADDAGCSATGTLAPHKGHASSTGSSSSKTVVGILDVQLTFNGASCALGNGRTLQGIVIPPSSTVNGAAQLQIVTATGDKKNGFMLVANRQ